MLSATDTTCVAVQSIVSDSKRLTVPIDQQNESENQRYYMYWQYTNGGHKGSWK